MKVLIIIFSLTFLFVAEAENNMGSLESIPSEGESSSGVSVIRSNCCHHTGPFPESRPRVAKFKVGDFIPGEPTTSKPSSKDGKGTQ